MTATALARKDNVLWAPTPNCVETHLGVPPVEVPVTSAQAIVTSPAGILLTYVRSRGWDLPGGHLDPGETPAEAALRETIEETGVVLPSVSTFGYTLLTVTAPKPEPYNYPYPRTAQQVFTCVLEDAVAPSPDLTLECDEAQWIHLDEARKTCHMRDWVTLLDHLTH